MKRRSFIKKSVLTSSVFSIVPSHVLGFKGLTPNNKIQMGFIGAGRQGRGLMTNFVKYDSATVVAVSDVDNKKMSFFSETFHNELNKNNKTLHQLDEIKYYRELLNRKDIDAVVIATPDHWHAQMAIDAAKAGKDIYCEKPLSSTVAEGRSMVDAARKYQCIFQTGSMQRSWDSFRHGVELIRNGYIGEIKEVKVAIGAPLKVCDLPTQETPSYIDWDAWIGPVPYRGYHDDLACPLEDKRWGKWRDYKPFGGGMITDFGAHMFDIVQWALDQDHSGPIQFNPPSIPAESGLTFNYLNGIKVTHTKWGNGNNEIQFNGSEGHLEISRRYLKTYPNKSLAKTPLKDSDTNRVYKSDDHYQDWLNSIRSRKRPICDAEIGHRTASVCNIANIAYALQRPLEWNPVREGFVNDPGANLMLDRAYRAPWNYRDF